jgi:hypothetical protein
MDSVQGRGLGACALILPLIKGDREEPNCQPGLRGRRNIVNVNLGHAK